MISNRVIIGIQPESEDVTDPLMQEVVIRMILKEEQKSVVEIHICKRLMDFLMMQTKYL